MKAALEFLTLALMILGSGCRTASPSLPASAAGTARVVSPEKLQCQMQRLTGSLLAVKVCTTQAQRDAIKASAQSVPLQIGNTQGKPCARGSPGC